MEAEVVFKTMGVDCKQWDGGGWEWTDGPCTFVWETAGLQSIFLRDGMFVRRIGDGLPSLRDAILFTKGFKLGLAYRR